MSLLGLSPEILIEIFDYVGSAYFRSDLARITVSKQWGKYAHTACFQDLCINQKTLRHLVSSPYLQASARPIKDSLRSVSLTLSGFDDWSSVNKNTGDPIREPWQTKLTENLEFLAVITSASPKLRFLSIKATTEPSYSCPGPPRQDYVYLSTIRSFLSASNLSKLDLDLCGSRLISFRSDPHEGSQLPHICPLIATHLTNLQSLRLRMREICPDVLKIQTTSTKLRLKKVIICLSLADESSSVNLSSYALRCGSVPGAWGVISRDEVDRLTQDFLHLKTAMETQAQVLVTHMADPEMVRIVAHTPPSSHLKAFDAVTRHTPTLNLDATQKIDWDCADINDREPERDMDEISDFWSDGDDDEAHECWEEWVEATEGIKW
jgi:hypothetical protein